MATGDDGFWVFGYGSLLWKPGFSYAEQRLARLDGFHRRFALKSVHYRGTEENPGLVLGLDWRPGAHCLGAAFRVRGADSRDVRRYLYERELVSYSYFELRCPIDLIGEDGAAERDTAICYVLDRTHRQYRGDLTLEQQAEIIAKAEGPMGPNAEYLYSTVAHLTEIGIEDQDLLSLERLVRQIRGDG